MCEPRIFNDFGNDIVRSENSFVQNLTYDIEPDCQFPDIYDIETF